jgi:hypothetical protein
VDGVEAGDENAGAMGRALDEATGRTERTSERERVSASGPDCGRDAVVLGSGNLGLIYLMRSPHRLTLEEINERHPRLIPALLAHPHIGFILVRSSVEGALALGAEGSRRLADGAVTGVDPLAGFAPGVERHLRRTDGFANVADVVVNSFYDPLTEEGCAFEELVSFHGGTGGAQTRPFILYPASLPAPAEPLVGAVSVHRQLQAWRAACNGARAAGPVTSDANAPAAAMLRSP